MKLFSLFATIILALSAPAATNDAPAVVAAIVPPYNAIARTAHVSGEITVDVEINSFGKVVSAKMSGHPLLAKSAKEAAEQWCFVPTSENSIKRRATLVFAFRLMRGCSPATDLTPIFYPPYKIEVRGETPPRTCSDCSPEEQEKLRCPDP
ncbi:MAG: hypothetical protein QOF62_1027 [Pyrinomonadaceae bacterium]|jgi:TonB family protein|nr:hypothetical protein [Pyrinomonadaceae bacterium]